MIALLTTITLLTGAALLLSSGGREGLSDLLGVEAGDTYIVDHDGAGDFESIIAAIREASDGDTIVLKPGRYSEWVRVPDKDITIVGEGDRADVIVESGYDNTFYVSDSALTLSNLTVIGQEYGFAIDSTGEGSILGLDGVDLQVRGSWCCEHTPVRWDGGATGFLRGSTVEGKVDVQSGSSVTIEGNDLASACIEVGAAAEATIRGNTIRGCPLGYGVAVRGGSALIEGNEITVPASDVTPGWGMDEDRVAISVGSTATSTTIRGNAIGDSLTAIRVGPNGKAHIEANEVRGVETGIEVSEGAAVIRGNRILDGGTGLSISDAAPTIEANEVTGNAIGISAPSEVDLAADNTICGNDVDLDIAGPASGGSVACAARSPVVDG
jgi:hypothetical protein